VSSEIHINGQCVSELVHEDKGLKRMCVVLSKGHEVVGLGYSRLTGVAAKVIDKGENSSNYSRVNRFSKAEQHYPSQVSQVGRVCQNSRTDRWTDRVSWVNRDSQVGNTEQKAGGSSRGANMEIWVTENLANTESRVTQNLANAESRVMQHSANVESWVT
jgi:hypothetical protein